MQRARKHATAQHSGYEWTLLRPHRALATDPALEQKIKMGNKLGYAAIQHYYTLRNTVDSPEFQVWERLTRGDIRTARLCGNML